MEILQNFVAFSEYMNFINKLIPFPPVPLLCRFVADTAVLNCGPVSSDTRSPPTWVSRLKPCLKKPALLCLLLRIHKILGVILAVSSKFCLKCTQPVKLILKSLNHCFGRLGWLIGTYLHLVCLMWNILEKLSSAGLAKQFNFSAFTSKTFFSLFNFF